MFDNGLASRGKRGSCRHQTSRSYEHIVLLEAQKIRKKRTLFALSAIPKYSDRPTAATDAGGPSHRFWRGWDPATQGTAYLILQRALGLFGDGYSVVSLTARTLIED